jgi:hypothetical protein
VKSIGIYVNSQTENLLQKDDAPKQNENTIASRYNGNPISLIKSNKNSGNANHRRRNSTCAGSSSASVISNTAILSWDYIYFLIAVL